MASTPSVMTTPSPAATALTKGARTRARILTAAAEHFAAVGLDGGSVPEIARTIGVSHAAIYQHFGRKDELFRAAVEADLTALFASLDPTFDRGRVDPDTVVGLLGTIVKASRRHPLARRVIADIDRDQTQALWDLPALTELERRLTSGLAAAQEIGTVRADVDAATLAAGVVGMALPMLVVAFRLDGIPHIPRAAASLDLLAMALRPPTSTTIKGKPR